MAIGRPFLFRGGLLPKPLVIRSAPCQGVSSQGQTQRRESDKIMSNARTASSHRGPSTGLIIMEFLGSMNLAITLLAALAIASTVGTFLQQNQAYTDYIIKFGPFWHDVFRTLGLYDIYSASWFLFLVGFLLVSTSVCVYRNTPIMLRDLRQFRLNVQEKSLKSFKHKRELSVAGTPAQVLDTAAAVLQLRGYRVRSKDHGDHQLLSAMRGGANRLGYVLTHSAIIVICISGLLLGNLPGKLAELRGERKIETRAIPASQVPAVSRLSPNNFAFRGSVNVTEGSSANIVFINIRDGYLVQELPFAVEVKDFRIDHYSTGMPKAFKSDIVIHDDALAEPLEATIAVNHPLIYKGYAIYQASFSDGGSRLKLHLWPTDTRNTAPGALDAAVFESYALKTGSGQFTLELDNFSLFNVNPVTGPDGQVTQKNMGPSFTYKMRDAAGAAVEFQNYMNPIEQEGRYFYLSGRRASPAEPFQYLHIPMDSEGGIERFMAFLTYVQDPKIIAEAAQMTSRLAIAQEREDAQVLRERMSDTLEQLLARFNQGGMAAVAQDVEARIPADQRAQAMEAFAKLLQSGLRQIYLRMLADRGIEASPADAVYFQDAVSALSVIPFYGTPYYIQMSEFEHIQASGLQIAKRPGSNLFFIGSVMLVAGVFLLFYVAHRRLWLWVKSDGQGGSQLLFAGMSNRNMLEFDKQFEALAADLEKALQPGSGASSA